MEAYSRDFLRDIGKEDDETRRGEEMTGMKVEVDLTLELSLGGRFGLQRRSGDRLAGSSSSAASAVLAPLVLVDYLSAVRGSGSLSREGTRSWSLADLETELMEEMPGVCTVGLPRRAEGLLYRYKEEKGDVVIACLCHGLFLSPEEFLEHAGAVNVENAMHRIVMK